MAKDLNGATKVFKVSLRPKRSCFAVLTNVEVHDYHRYAAVQPIPQIHTSLRYRLDTWDPSRITIQTVWAQNQRLGALVGASLSENTSYFW